MKTITLEELTPETRQTVEDWLAGENPITFLRGGQLCGELTSFSSEDDFSAPTPEEEEELREVFEKAEANYAAGNYLTLDEFKRKYADRLNGSAK